MQITVKQRYITTRACIHTRTRKTAEMPTIVLKTRCMFKGQKLDEKIFDVHTVSSHLASEWMNTTVLFLYPLITMISFGQLLDTISHNTYGSNFTESLSFARTNCYLYKDQNANCKKRRKIYFIAYYKIKPGHERIKR